MKFKTLASLVLGVCCLCKSSIASDFTGTLIDPATINTNPALAINQNTGTQHLVWSRGNELIYANSSDNFQNKRVVSNLYTNYSKPSIDLDSLGNVHIGFVAYDTSWRTFYTNSVDWIPRRLNMGNADEDISLKLDRNNKLYIAGVRDVPGKDLDIIIASSTDYGNFNYLDISKSSHQFNPSIDIDSKNNVHLVYWDWSDGVSNGCGQYKTRYRSSLDNFVSEELISSAPQSYGANLDIDRNDNVWVSFKDSTYFPESFDRGDVFLADKSSGWNKTRITPDSIDFMQDRPTDLCVNSLSKYVVWSQVDFNSGEVDIMYADSSLANLQVAGVGYNPGLGWAVIDSYNNKPYISANLNSLSNFTVPEPASAFLVGSGVLLGLGLLSRRKMKDA